MFPKVLRRVKRWQIRIHSVKHLDAVGEDAAEELKSRSGGPVRAVQVAVLEAGLTDGVGDLGDLLREQGLRMTRLGGQLRL